MRVYFLKDRWETEEFLTIIYAKLMSATMRSGKLLFNSKLGVLLSEVDGPCKKVLDVECHLTKKHNLYNLYN